MTPSRPSASAAGGSPHRVRELAVLLRSGVLAPSTPNRLAAQYGLLRRLGPTLAGAYAMGAVRKPHRVAVLDEDTSRTYLQLDERVRGIVRGLTRLGVRAGDPVAILGRNGVPFVEALVAVSRLGADALLLSAALSVPQAGEVLARERAAVAIVDEELLPLLDQAPTDLIRVTMREADPRPVDAAQRRLLSLEDLAAVTGEDPEPSTERGRLIVLTSGTTGTPKSARRPAPQSLSPAASVLSRLRLSSRDTVLIASPLFHTWALGMLHISAGLTATVVLRGRTDAEVVLDAVARDGCTAVTTVPVILERILQLPHQIRGQYERSALRLVASCGAPLTGDVATRFQDTFGDVLYNVYGSTEISWATIATPADLRAAPGTAGRPPLGTRLLLLDEIGQPVPQGQVGRIFVGNDLLFEGYTREATDRTAALDLTRALDVTGALEGAGVDAGAGAGAGAGGEGSPEPEGLLGTGDLGYLDRDGRLMVVGREDDLVISGAEKVYPLEVQQVIETLPGVQEVAVTGRPDAELGQRLVAYVVPAPGAAMTEREVQDHVRQRLARFAVPKEVHFLCRLPRTATGKVMSRMLVSAGVE